MVVEYELVDSVVLLYEQPEITHLVVRLDLEWAPDVALPVGRAFLESAELVAVTLGPAKVPATFKDYKLRLVLLHVQLVAMQDAAMDDDVVTFAEGEVAEHRLEHAA